MVIYDRFKNLGRIIENSYGPIIPNRERSYFFKNRDNNKTLKILYSNYIKRILRLLKEYS
jgi:hypothetical protein